MYCNKIILRAWLPNHHFRDIPLILGTLSPLSSHGVKTKASRFLTGTMKIFFFSNIVFQEKLSSILSFALRQLRHPGISLSRPSLPLQ